MQHEQTPAVDIVAEIDTISEERGFLEACRRCPLQLTCASGKYPDAFWCSKCQNVYLLTLDKVINCDVLRMAPSALPNGMCPCCNGREVELLQGVSLSDRVPKR